MKKIVFVINYFYPDLASTGQLMTELCANLEDEFEITVIAAQPGYSKQDIGTEQLSSTYGKIKVVRLKLPVVNKNSKISRIKYISTYFIKALFAIIKEKKIDLIYTISQPPIVGGFLGSIGKTIKNTKHIYNIQDFNPEQALAAKYTKDTFISKVALAIDKFNCSYADHVILVGEDMSETLKIRFDNKKIPDHSVINNWTEEKDIVPLDENNKIVKDFKFKHGLNGKFIIMYSGNLGLYYDLENLIKITKDFVQYQDIIFLFIGDGAKKSELQEYVLKNKLSNVMFLPYQPLDYIKYSLNVADAHLVVNQKGIKGVSVPSKIYGVLAAGKPIIGVLEDGSEAHRLIIESGSGYVSEPQDYNNIKKTIINLYQLSKFDREKMGLLGRRYLEKNLKKEMSIRKYKDLLTRITL